MKLDQRQLDDLIKLAQSRCESEVRRVTQLMDDGPQVYVLSIMLAITMIRGAAEVLQDGLKDKNGKRLSDEHAIHRALGDILDGLGIDYERREKPKSKG
jgi:hypothetical protein